MKFKVGDQVVITSGKDKGKKGEVARVLPDKNAVIVPGVNVYTRHIKPLAGQPGDRRTLERPLSTAKIAILNNKGEADRIGYSVDKKGAKTRVFKKSGEVIADKKEAKAAKKK